MCFTGSIVNTDNIDVCNEQFWGFIVGALYIVLVGSIAWFWWNRKKRAIKYDIVSVQ